MIWRFAFLFLQTVRAERKRRGLTQFQLAHAAGISLPTLIAAEQGKNILLESGLRIAAALERIPAPDVEPERASAVAGA